MKKLIAVVGARPQFIKHAAVEIEARGRLELVTVHTGQHYDENMSRVFFDELDISRPDFQLATGNLSHGAQTGRMLEEIENIVSRVSPDGLLVYGDTNSTLAGALVAAKIHLPLIHVEAGLRSFNKKMPEEINRVLTDHCSNYFFVTSPNAALNLEAEGLKHNIHNVGDVMRDMVRIGVRHLTPVEYSDYYYCTLHRPSNVDCKDRLKSILDSLDHLNKRVIFAIHPRTENRIEASGIKLKDYRNILQVPPASYFENLAWLTSASGLITDSGGMQKEAYWLKKVCVTLRGETEWAETLDEGWNTLVNVKFDSIQSILEKTPARHKELYGDGHAAKRIVDEILQF